MQSKHPKWEGLSPTEKPEIQDTLFGKTLRLLVYITIHLFIFSGALAGIVWFWQIIL